MFAATPVVSLAAPLLSLDVRKERSSLITSKMTSMREAWEEVALSSNETFCK
jgi:hypothetical protein